MPIPLDSSNIGSPNILSEEIGEIEIEAIGLKFKKSKLGLYKIQCHPQMIKKKNKLVLAAKMREKRKPAELLSIPSWFKNVVYISKLFIIKKGKAI